MRSCRQSISSLPGKAIRYIALMLFAALMLVSGKAMSQPEEEFDEISVFVTIQQVGGMEMPAVLKGNTLYLPIADLFRFLKIKTIVSDHMDSVSGFFLNPDMPYMVDYPNRRIILKDKSFDLKKDEMILTENDLYIDSKYFDPLFGLNCKFSFRSLTVNIVPAVELPVIREFRLEMMRKNISKLTGDIIADTVIRRSYPKFSFGMADYSIISTQTVNGPCDNRFALNLGGILLGGEAEVGINYSTLRPFTEQEQYYLWRYANNDLKAVRQVMAGKINSMATSSIYAPVVGAQVTNTPTTYRRSFGSYTLSDYTNPGWIVELYVNNVLVDYVRSDASGFYTFQVPMVYGSSDVKLKFYGPWGEEKTREHSVSIPYTFLPAKELEYTVSGGIVEDSSSSRFSRGNVNYGLSRWMTVGGGVEYLSSVTSGPFMPFVNTSLRLGSSMLINADYMAGVRFKGEATYRLPSSLQFDALYIHYQKGQTAINYNISEERKIVVSAPFSGRRVSTYTRLTLDQIILPETSSFTAELLLSGSFYGVNTNFTTYLLMAERTSPYVYSNLALGFRLPYGFIVTPQAQYDYSNTSLISAKIEVEKRLFSTGYANISFERNQRSNINNLQVGMRYDLSGLQTAFTFRQTNRLSNFIESARGSFITDHKTHTTAFISRTVTGRGGMVIIPFLDVNNNGKRDPNEPKLAGLNIKVNGGWVEESPKDTILRIYDMEPYTYYILTADQNSIKNIAWRLTHSTFKVYVDANQLKLLEIPVAVRGEASGYVYVNKAGGQKGQGRIIVNFYREDGSKVGSVLTEQDGYFSFLGFPPGKYHASLDTAQMQKVGLKIVSSNEEFSIKQNVDGDVVDDLEFILISTVEKKPETAPMINKSEEKKSEKPAEIKPLTPAVAGSVIRIGVFKKQQNADSVMEIVNPEFPGQVIKREEAGLFKIELTVPATESAKALELLKSLGFKDAYLLKK